MERKKVFVFPCGSEIGLEIGRSLRYAKEVELWGGSSVENHGKFAFTNYISNIPFFSEEGFIPYLNDIIGRHKFDYIVPAHDDVVITLAEAHERGDLLCKVLTSDYETCHISRSKKKTLTYFKNRIVVPEIYSDLSQVNKWPVFLKPDKGQGSNGAVIAHTLEEAKYRLAKDPSLIILEYLPGNEYTIDCFTDRHGSLIFSEGRQRCRISNGISVNTKPVTNPIFREIAEIINTTLTFRGVWFFQLKENSAGELTLLEIAPRIAGTMGMYRNQGINFALLSIYDAEDIDVIPIVNDFNIEMDRALSAKFKIDITYDDVYIDFDDCLLINNVVNTMAISFVYQCINRGIKVHLITKHAGDIFDSLKKHRLENLFDSVILIKAEDKKSNHISAPNSIFIDDSFSERLVVKKEKMIPVFSPDSIESLLE